jgi:hypothetical protein
MANIHGKSAQAAEIAKDGQFRRPSLKKPV